MEDPQVEHNIWVIWRGKRFNVEISSDATVKDLGHELQKLTDVKADTMRLIIPQFSDKSSKMLSPFSDEHQNLSLQEASIVEGKSIRMMGVSENEVDEVLQSAKANLRIAGFDEEEERLRQRMTGRPQSLKLPQGPYIFCEFQTLQLPGIELNPPASEALKRMHMLAADPGIISVMNKHRWRVGIMTEMAPVGYVGISPKCILGFNKNHGEEISLRLRTDDLKGFRKYESIKKTLLHELAHMVYSEHDANFYALDKQLNQEAESLDWTRSTSHTLSGVRYPERYEEDFIVGDRSNSSQKLGGNISDQLPSARSASVVAAYHRMATVSHDSVSVAHEESHPDDSGSNMQKESKLQKNPDIEPDPDAQSDNQNKFEPSPDDSQGTNESSSQFTGSGTLFGKDFGESMICQPELVGTKSREEPDPDNMDIMESRGRARNNVDEPDPDDLDAKADNLGYGSFGNIIRPKHDSSLVTETIKHEDNPRKAYYEPDPDDSQSNGVNRADLDPDTNLVHPQDTSRMQIDEPDPDDQEFQRIQGLLLCEVHQHNPQALEAPTVKWREILSDLYSDNMLTVSGIGVYNRSALVSYIEVLTRCLRFVNVMGFCCGGKAGREVAASPAVVVSLPSVVVSGGGSECVICKEEMREDRDVCELPCRHLFHWMCILRWLRKRNTCPCCRFTLPTEDVFGEIQRLWEILVKIGEKELA